jgi:hypothetical protein
MRKSFVTAVRRVAHAVDVPGTPRSLLLDDVQVEGDGLATGHRTRPLARRAHELAAPATDRTQTL